MKRRLFTKKEQDFIKKNYLTMPTKTLAAKIKASGSMLRRYLERNNLIIPTELAQKRQRESGFKKGNIPFNKGLKQTDYMSADAIERSSKTRIKPGNRPHNTNLEGYGAIVLRLDNRGVEFFFTKTREGWQPLHRVIWEKEYGKIKEGELIVFKDKNYKNVKIENLEKICRVENMYRNSLHDYPREIIPSKVLINKIESKLKKY